MQGPAVCAIDGGCIARRLIACVLLLSSQALAPQAQAQVSANVSLATSNVFRGESTSGDDPAASLEVSYDHPSGLFVGASVAAAFGEHDPHFNGSTQYAGYALRRGETSLEIGVIHRDYDSSSLFDDAYSPHYFEGFVGVTRRSVRLRLYVSPDYLRDGRTTYYGELNGRLLKLGKWSINGHSGLSVIPPELGETGTRYYHDLSLQANRSYGKFALGIGVAETNYPVFAPDEGPGLFQNKPRVFASISRAF
jgi:uncharacterized protein (TIGR02001 family)